MNWQLVTTVVLALQAPYNLGMASSSSNGTVLTSVSSVSVEIAETDSEQTVTLTDDGSGSPTVNILLKFQDDIAAIGFGRDYLNLPTDIGVSFSTTNATNYPAEEAYTKLYPPENVVPLGPLLSFELPYSAIKFNDDAAQKVVIVMPLLSPQYRGFFDPADPLGVEVRIKRADGSESFSLEEYVAGGGITIYKGALDRAYGDTPPNVISVSVQPVDYSGVLKQRQQNRQDKQSLGTAQVENDESDYHPDLYYASLVATSPDGRVQAQMAEVSVTQNAGEVPLEQETKTFDGETPIGMALPSGSKLAVGIGSLKSPTPITLKTFDNRPEGGAPPLACHRSPHRCRSAFLTT